MPVPSAKSFDNVSMAKKILENPFGVNNKQRTEPLAKPGISQPPPARTPPRRAMHALTAADLAELPPEQRAAIRACARGKAPEDAANCLPSEE